MFHALEAQLQQIDSSQEAFAAAEQDGRDGRVHFSRNSCQRNAPW